MTACMTLLTDNQLGRVMLRAAPQATRLCVHVLSKYDKPPSYFECAFHNERGSVPGRLRTCDDCVWWIIAACTTQRE